MTYDVVIIGGGAAGMNAALYSGRAGLSSVVIEQYGAGGQMNYTDSIDNYLGFDNNPSGYELADAMRRHALKFGSEIVSDTVLEIKDLGSEKRVITSKGEYRARTVIYAAGAEAKKLGIDGEDKLAGVSYCAACDGGFYKDKTTVVIGGGNTACEDALYLARLCKKVTVVIRGESFRADKTTVAELEKCRNVEIIRNHRPSKIQGDSKVSSVILEHTLSGRIQLVQTDAVFVAIGRNPRNEVLKGLVELDKNGFVITDKKLATSVEGIFAAGDVRDTPLRQIITAAADGAVAASSAVAYLNERR